MATEISSAEPDSHAWTMVTISDNETIGASMIECIEWLSQHTHPGRFTCRWQAAIPVSARKAKRSQWFFRISDPDVAFAFKMRFG